MVQWCCSAFLLFGKVDPSQFVAAKRRAVLLHNYSTKVHQIVLDVLTFIAYIEYTSSTWLY